MSDKREYGIFDRAWQPVVGCREDLPCAANCWAKRTCHRLAAWGQERTPVRNVHRQVMSVRTTGDPIWNGSVVLNEVHLLDPLKWRKPATVATGFHGDIALLAPEELDRIFAVMALCPHLRFFLLSKRPERLMKYFDHQAGVKRIVFANADEILQTRKKTDIRSISWNCPPWPLPNVSIGTSASTQAELDARMGPLMKLAAAGWRTHLFLEPLLEAVDVRGLFAHSIRCEKLPGPGMNGGEPCRCAKPTWVVLGGESGPRARPLHLDWVRRVRDGCTAAGVPFWFKQGSQANWPDYKHALLDDREYKQMPEVHDAR